MNTYKLAGLLVAAVVVLSVECSAQGLFGQRTVGGSISNRNERLAGRAAGSGGGQGGELNQQPGTLPALASVADYAKIASQNIFAVGLNTVDPLKHTFVTAITFSNGQPLVWITEQLSDRVTRTGPGESFTTAAMSGSIVEVLAQEVVVESSGQRLLLSLGSPLSEAKPVTP